MHGTTNIIFSRGLSASLALRSSLREPLKTGGSQAIHDSHDATSQTWKKVFLYGCIPACVLAAFNVFVLMEEPKRSEYKPYDYLGIMNVRFPWRDGKKSLFFNPHVNHLKD
ncbi:UNVERIFIED_CONTAM: hypothetical protein PYX00_005196 [Menopon gallinae]|uniref:Uncharacterized protein n=1 Tax=Menopon gallinae TaxID=328185 RepID=A0AAW2HRA4_9NEOP